MPKVAYLRSGELGKDFKVLTFQNANRLKSLVDARRCFYEKIALQAALQSDAQLSFNRIISFDII